MTHQLPFTVTAKTLNLIASISEQLGRLSAWDEQAQALRLRRVNQIRTIQGSLAIGQSTAQTDCAPFIEFMLAQIEQALSDQVNATQQADPQVDNEVVAEILQKQPGLVNFCQTLRSRTELQSFCGLKDREQFRKSILKPLLAAGWLTPTLLDKPNSPEQTYFFRKDVTHV